MTTNQKTHLDTCKGDDQDDIVEFDIPMEMFGEPIVTVEKQSDGSLLVCYRREFRVKNTFGELEEGQN